MATNLTVAQLERLLDRQRAKLERLLRRRATLQRQLAQVERSIAAIGGALEESPRKKRKRPRNDRTLLQVVTEVLTGNKKGLTLKDLARQVLETGYKTGSANFENTVYQIVYNNSDKIQHDAKTKTYRLK